jgi:hypothetical protein
MNTLLAFVGKPTLYRRTDAGCWKEKAGLRRFRDDGVPELTQALDSHDDIVPGAQEAGWLAGDADAGGSAGGDNIAGLEREDARQE